MIKHTIKIMIVFCLAISCKDALNSKNESKKEHYSFKFEDPNLEIDERVNDLISRMTLKEKVSQMRYDAPAIDRLHIPAYNWWNECLHGVARAGLATVFPQGIAMGATWNDRLIQEMGSVVSDEARAKHHKFIEEDQRAIYQGLTFWTPNINIFRDPRWGRGQETYGEDPFLTSKIGVNYIKGLQGNDDRHYKLVATAKHFAVHSGPEKSRHRDNYKVSDQDLYETYLPAFEAAVKEANVHSVMCAYNRFRDEACCGSNLLLQKILRDDWNFEGYVVSDCWAINDFWEPDKHHIVETAEEAAALAVDRGTDLNCGNVFDPNLTEAVLNKMIDETKLDLALFRLFRARFKLGMFDPVDQVKWANIPYEVVASDKHRGLSERVARESMVLLKNENGLLPLSKSLKSIAVIGPNADSKKALLGNYHGTPRTYSTLFSALKEKLPNTQINYALGCNIANGWPALETIPSEILSYQGKPGLYAEYFGNRDLSGNPSKTEVFEDIEESWLENYPLDSIVNNEFSVRWTGQLIPKESSVYRLGFRASNGVKLFLDGSLQFEFDNQHEPGTKYVDVALEKGNSYDLKIEYSNYHVDPQAALIWAKLDHDLLSSAIEAANKSEVIILCLGLAPDIEGEEMPVVLDGFDKGDRTDIGLPQTQVELIKSIASLNKPTILVLMNGSALAINWADDHIPAILEAWYPGEKGGKAISDILFGDYNPAGRLPVTFYRSTSELPDFKDYSMKNRTYKYYQGTPLYPFGYGLSYTTFSYSNLRLPAKIASNTDIKLSVDVTNSGNREGDEVVQVYMQYPESMVQAPLRKLIGFKRIHLNPGETKTVEFVIQPNDYISVNLNGQKLMDSGTLNVTVGGSQPVPQKHKKANVSNFVKGQIQYQ